MTSIRKIRRRAGWRPCRTYRRARLHQQKWIDVASFIDAMLADWNACVKVTRTRRTA